VSEEDTQLLCTFTRKGDHKRTIRAIVDHYEIVHGRVFVLQNMREPNELFCTYNIKRDRYEDYLDKTISIHRKRETDTLYTINALNKLIEYLNDGELDETYPVPWKDYRNSLLVTNNGEFQKIDTQLFDIIDLDDDEAFLNSEQDDI